MTEPRFDTIMFLSDLGTTDESVGVVKAVIRDLGPDIGVIDLTHEIAPFDVRAGSLALARSIGYVPSGVVLASVDPGAATDGRCVAIEVAGGAGVIVGPDNGLLAPAVAMAGGAERAVVLAVESTSAGYRLESPGATCPVRDVLAPAAAHICNGVDLGELGSDIDPVLLLPGTVPLPRLEGDELVAEVLWVDRFGNVQLNIGPADVPPHWDDHLVLRIGAPTDPTGVTTRRARRVGGGTPAGELVGGEVGVVLDSHGMLAIAMERRSAAEELGVVATDQVTISPGDAPPAPETPVELGRR